MISDQFSDTVVNTVLRQEGADRIKTLPAHINIVTFKLSEEFELQYVYEMKENKSIYLERVTPYAYFLGEPKDIDELVETIMQDARRYKHAYESNNFDLFLSIEGKTFNAINQLETVLLNRDYANREELQAIDGLLDKLNDKWKEVSAHMIEDPEDKD